MSDELPYRNGDLVLFRTGTSRAKSKVIVLLAPRDNNGWKVEYIGYPKKPG